ncbi:MAG: hypothetical protein ACFE89_06550 [Candidatus Hodarchaeota archaeon]
MLAQLEARSELMGLEEEEDELQKDIEKLEEELEKGDRSIAEIEKEMAPLKKRIKELKSREKKLKAKVKEFEFEKLGKERHQWKDKLEKLEELKGSGEVRESIYLRLHEEYSRNQAEADAQYQEHVVIAREWLALLKAQYKAARDELSMLDARLSVGEVKEIDYKSSKTKTEKRAKTLGHQVEIFEKVLRDF